MLTTSALAILAASPALAAEDVNLKSLQAEIQAMRQAYEGKIEQLEQKVETLSAAQAAGQTAMQNQTAAVASVEPAAGVETSMPATSVPATSRRRISDNGFNPEIGVILQGKFQSFSENESEFAGFAVGEEAERGGEGFGIDETELNFSASVDNVFRGSATVALHEHEGETEVEIEEAYVETLALPYGLNAKAGRFGLIISTWYDLPSSPVIVCTYPVFAWGFSKALRI